MVLYGSLWILTFTNDIFLNDIKAKGVVSVVFSRNKFVLLMYFSNHGKMALYVMHSD